MLEELKKFLDVTGKDVLTGKGKKFTLRKEYFWTPKKTPEESFAPTVAKLTEAGYKLSKIEYGNKYKSFKGGESVKNNSHYWMTFTIEK